MVINGKQIALDILTDLKKRIEFLKTKNITPHLYIILLSNDESSASYVKQKMLRGEEIGINITLEKADLTISTDKLIEKINKLNSDNSVHAIIVQRPLPNQIDNLLIANTVLPQKDVDGFNENSNYTVPVARAIFTILTTIIANNLPKQLKNKRVAIVGKGLTAGQPIINYFRNLGVEVDIIDSKTPNRNFVLQNSDIIISAVGKSNTIYANEIKKGSIVIGVGLHKESDGKFYGDFNEEEISKVASLYTPTPGGVGPINVACLMENVVIAAEKSLK